MRVATGAGSHGALQHDADRLTTQVPERSASPGGFAANTSQPALETMPGNPGGDTASRSQLEAMTLPTASTVPVSSAAASVSAGALQPLLSVVSGLTAVSTPNAAPLHSAGGDVAAGDANWADAFSERVLTMAGKQVQRAEIRLHPAELGSVQIRISVEDDATTLSFTAQSAVARDAIEQALPRLRELFADSGLTLGNATVSGNGARQHEGEEALATATAAEADAQSGTDADHAGQDTTARQLLRSANRLIDTFA
jgi:flagellar hook-length control protein FliK